MNFSICVLISQMCSQKSAEIFLTDFSLKRWRVPFPLWWEGLLKREFCKKLWTLTSSSFVKTKELFGFVFFPLTPHKMPRRDIYIFFFLRTIVWFKMVKNLTRNEVINNDIYGFLFSFHVYVLTPSHCSIFLWIFLKLSVVQWPESKACVCVLRGRSGSVSPSVMARHAWQTKKKVWSRRSYKSGLSSQDLNLFKKRKKKRNFWIDWLINRQHEVKRLKH